MWWRKAASESRSLDVADVCLVTDSGISSQDALQQMRAALLPMARATTILMGDFNLVIPSEQRLDVGSGAEPRRGVLPVHV